MMMIIMMTPLFPTLVLLCSLACAQGIDCPQGFQKFQTRCYAYVDQKMAWADAESTCAALGGFLPEVFSAEEGKFILDFAKRHGSHDVWLGAEDLLVQGLWTWARSGQPLTSYSDWHRGQPENDPNDDENCLLLGFDNFGGQWGDEECHHNHRFICQRPIDTGVSG